MTTFHLKTQHFEVLLEDVEDPMKIVKELVSFLGSDHQMGKAIKELGPEDEEGSSKNALISRESNLRPTQAISLDSFLSEKRPDSCRKMLQHTSEYLTEVLLKETFSRDELVNAALASKYFKKDWRNHVSINIKRMIEQGYLVELLDGSFRPAG